jgi:hypothetical protein
VGKVYRAKIFTIDFDTDYKYLKFINKNPSKVVIEIDVEKLDYVVSTGVPDDELAASRNKVQTILMESEST